MQMHEHEARWRLMADALFKLMPPDSGQPIEVEWISFVPNGPIFAITDWPKMHMLVGFDDAPQ